MITILKNINQCHMLIQNYNSYNINMKYIKILVIYFTLRTV